MMCVDRTRTAATICAYPNCAKAVWLDPDGSYSAYCGRTHRDLAKIADDENTQICQQCKMRPVYIENGRAHPYCGQRCASAACTGKLVERADSITPPDPREICKLYNCIKGVWVGSDGIPSQYCSERHRKLVVVRGESEACLLCGKYPKAMVNGKYRDFCSKRCADDATGHAPLILQLQENHQAYKDVVEQFAKAWKHPTNAPKVVRVWRIYGNKATTGKFSRYQLQVERRTNIPEGNTRRRWHGTVRACKLGDSPDQRDICLKSNCFICKIIRASYQVAKFGQRHNFGRFGRGIYTSGTSSKADSYVQEPGNSQYKAMLLNEVVMGKGISLTVDDPGLVQPPAGYDSVIGEPGNSLNYDESIVYNDDAIRPMFLVIYNAL